MRTRIKAAGFTIVEMLMVIAVLAVLVCIVGTAASSAIRQARARQADALKQLIQVGIATYRAQKGWWPPKGGKLDRWSENGVDTNNGEASYLPDSDYDNMMRELATVSVKGKSSVPVMDVSKLIVTTRSAASKKDGHGQEFSEAVKKHKKHGTTLKLNDMAFGYLESTRGYFRRFRVRYNPESDSVTVEKQ